jgi:hypothetical protein
MSGWFIEVIIWSSVAALCALIGKDDFFSFDITEQ